MFTQIYSRILTNDEIFHHLFREITRRDFFHFYLTQMLQRCYLKKEKKKKPSWNRHKKQPFPTDSPVTLIPHYVVKLCNI